MSPLSVRPRDGAERTTLRIGRLLAALGAALVALVLTAGTAMAATTTQIASSLTNPLGILQVPAADGASHVWVSDHLNGVCRMDPAAGGGLVENQSSCVLFIGKAALKPGQLSYDAVNSKFYVPDLSAKSLGVVRFAYDPAADSGHGGISLFSDRQPIAANCGLGGKLPWASAIGPDGNLYVAFKKAADIVRVNTPAGASQTCVTAGSASDGKKAVQLAFVGANLWEIDGNGLGVIPNAATAQGVKASAVVGSIAAPTSLAADPAHANALYVGNANALFTFDAGPTSTGASAQVASGFSFTTAIGATTSTAPGAIPVIVGDDTSNGTLNQTGRLFSVTI